MEEINITRLFYNNSEKLVNIGIVDFFKNQNEKFLSFLHELVTKL